jgi:translation initiation factor 2 subunit 1
MSSDEKKPAKEKKSSGEIIFKKQGFPLKDELVVAKAKRILPHCVFLDLLEYDNKEGMLHISEIAPGWVKNVRAHVQENQQVICKVMDIDKSKGYIDISLKRVSSGEKNAKMNEWKMEKKMTIMIQIIGRKLKKTTEVQKIIGKITEEYESLSELFSEMSKSDIDAVKEIGLPKNWEEEIINSVMEHIKSHRVKVTNVFHLKSFEPDGVDKIKELIKKIREAQDSEMEINYLGTPRYQITVLATDYKKAEETMENVLDDMEKLSEKLNIEFSRVK